MSGTLLPVNNIVDEMPWVGLSGPRLRTGTTNNEQRRCYCRGHWFGGLRARHSLREIGLALERALRTQPEVLRYAHPVAERFELRREIKFNTRMSQAVFNEYGQRWTVRNADGREWSAQAEGVHAFFWRRAWLPTHSRNVAADGYSGFTMTKGSVDAA